MWTEFNYCNIYHTVFSTIECEWIVAYHEKLSSTSGSLANSRESTIYWFPRRIDTDWVFSRVIGYIKQWNVNYNFELDVQGEQYMQLSCYRPGDRYDWHMDIGTGRMSTRKISAVVELGEPHVHGGGLEVFYGVHNTVPMLQGSVVIFPSWIMHRAVTPMQGSRWSLTAWINGSRPFV